MRQALVLVNKIIAGNPVEHNHGKHFIDAELRPISLAFPKQKEEYVSDELFPFFFNMLSEGANKIIQCQTLKIDEDDSFGLLLATAKHDTIGAITVKEL